MQTLKNTKGTRGAFWLDADAAIANVDRDAGFVPIGRDFDLGGLVRRVEFQGVVEAAAQRLGQHGWVGSQR